MIGYNGAMPNSDDPAPVATPGDLPETWQVDGEEELWGSTTVAAEGPPADDEPDPPRPPSAEPRHRPEPPSVDRLVEALLFVGGPPLTAALAGSVIKGLGPERYRDVVDALNRKYRAQGRPYSISPAGDGYTLSIRSAYRPVRERLFGGPRAVRLSQPALDVLALVAYRQPVGKGEIDSVRGADSGSVLRQLVRLGLTAVVRRGEAGSRDVAYGTTPRFLDLFGLASLDDLPRLGETQPL